MVIKHSLPVAIVEAKSPDVSAEIAIREARLYGQMINEQYPTDFNPVQFAIGCNGVDISVSKIDDAMAEHFSCSETSIIGSRSHARIRELLSSDALGTVAKHNQIKSEKITVFRAAQRLRPGFFAERITPNILAPLLTELAEMFLRSEDPEKINLIIERAYVDSAELREYDEILRVMLKQIERKMGPHHQIIETDRQREHTISPDLVRFTEQQNTQGKLNLIVGSRGAGKSLFIARFFYHLLPEKIKSDGVLSILDFNRAPSTISDMQQYICEQFIENVQNVNFDIYDYKELIKIFSVEINRLQRGPLALIENDHDRAKIIYQSLIEMQSDKKKFCGALARYISSEMRRPIIVAFDNVDRRESAQQLQIFQDAQWFRTHTRCFALLTLRDETYERYKREPPLDAYAQISHFQVRPPRFSLVLRKRLDLAIDFGEQRTEFVEQISTSGMRFQYNKEKLSIFLRAVYSALFDDQGEVGRILDALAERDVRDALGTFARIISSGHFNADKVISAGLSGKKDIIRPEDLLKILMRADYKWYNQNSGTIHNLFVTESHQSAVSIFCLTELLAFFAQNGGTGAGVDNIPGYWRHEEAVADLSAMGFSFEEISFSMKYCIQRKMLSFDGEDNDSLSDQDLIKIAPSGFIHLNVVIFQCEYIAAIAPHCNVSDSVLAETIFHIYSHGTNRHDLRFFEKFDIASKFVDYLVRQKKVIDMGNRMFRILSRNAEKMLADMTRMVNHLRPQADKFRAGQSRARIGREPAARRVRDN
jgi:hypothetical protein